MMSPAWILPHNHSVATGISNGSADNEDTKRSCRPNAARGHSGSWSPHSIKQSNQLPCFQEIIRAAAQPFRAASMDASGCFDTKKERLTSTLDTVLQRLYTPHRRVEHSLSST